MSETESTSPASVPSPEPTWLASSAPIGLAEDAEDRAGLGLGLLGQRRAERADRLAGDRLDQHLPDVGGVDDPLGPAPRGRGGHAGGEAGGLVEPVVGEPDGVGDTAFCCAELGVGSGCLGDGLAGQVERDVPVERPVVGLHHRLELAEELAEVGHALPPKNCSNGVPA